ncbi:glycosyltransferase [Photobacterium kishitanii]|uniref:glycosyltransferase n=1 Tax=Photobacterium kishitanii TaxID=318456 RepID=UPI00071AECF7|nr:glycosyltransferase family 2 protein [Photobacterium kishitanii]
MTDFKYKVSIIMSVYNEPIAWVKSAIDSILNQTYENIQFVIILDDPNNYEVDEYLICLSRIDLRITYKKNDINHGLVYSLNKALSLSDGDFIARMDADDISKKDRIENQLNYLLENNLDLIGSNIHLFTKNITDVFFTSDKLLSHKYLEKILYVGTIGIVHPTFFARKEVYEKLNGYKTSFHTEDKEFINRVFINGFKVGNISQSLLYCRYSHGSVTKNNALYVNKMGQYLTRLYRDYKKNGSYSFDPNYYNLIECSQEELDRYRNKQLMLSEARLRMKNKNYFIVFIFILRSLYYSSTSITNIRINLYMKYYKFLERFTNR